MDSSRCMRSGGAVLFIRLCEIFRPLSRGESRTLAVGLLGMACLWVRCTKAELSQIRKAPTGIGPDEAVAVMLDRFSDEFSLDKEDEFAGCIGTAIRAAYPTLRIVPPHEFRRLALPDLAPEKTPSKPWEELFQDPAFQERIPSLGIRYLISVHGHTVQQKAWGDIFCGSGYNWLGCLGLVAWDRQSLVTASVLDLKQGRAAGEARVEVSGRPWLSIFFIFPVGLPAFTETRACSEIGEVVVKFLAGDSPPKPYEGTEQQNQ